MIAEQNHKLRCIAIDDEPFALQIIADDIRKVPYLDLIDTFASPFEAWEILNTGQVDLLFLDIQIPTLTGIQFVKSLIQPPMVIFTTAYQQYALEGYDLNIVDYLVKPIPFDRFVKATNKAFELYSLRAKEAPEVVPTEVDYIVINADYKKIKLHFSDIVFVEGLKDYVKIYIQNETKPILTRSNLKSMEGKLPNKLFCRVHNSYIVSLEKITAFQKTKLLIGKIEIPVGNRFVDEFEQVYRK
jgi:DNA-binding LytR/AlgR family response regulator